MAKTQRKRTIQEHHSTARWKNKIYPSLKLSGKWLEDCGFNPQDKVQITVSKEVLLIELIKE